MITTEPDSGHRFIDSNCKCQFIIDDYVVEDNNGISLKISLSVLASTDASQVGKTMSEYFAVTKKTSKGESMGHQTLDLLLATRIISPEQRAATRKGAADGKSGESIQFDESWLKGRMCCGTVVLQAKQEQDSAGVWKDVPGAPMYPKLTIRGAGVYDVYDDKAAGIPLDMQMIVAAKLMPLAGQKAPVQQAATTQPAQQTAQQTAPAKQTPPPSPPSPPSSMNW